MTPKGVLAVVAQSEVGNLVHNVTYGRRAAIFRVWRLLELELLTLWSLTGSESVVPLIANLNGKIHRKYECSK